LARETWEVGDWSIDFGMGNYKPGERWVTPDALKTRHTRHIQTSQKFIVKMWNNISKSFLGHKDPSTTMRNDHILLHSICRTPLNFGTKNAASKNIKYFTSFYYVLYTSMFI
jgi:hypothetical protein